MSAYAVSTINAVSTVFRVELSSISIHLCINHKKQGTEEHMLHKNMLYMLHNAGNNG